LAAVSISFTGIVLFSEGRTVKMIKAAPTPVPDPTTTVQLDVRVALQAAKANLLIVGRDAEVARALRALDPIMRQPRLSGQTWALILPPRFDGTFVLTRRLDLRAGVSIARQWAGDGYTVSRYS
jgi:hypothetical protein